MHGSCEPSFQFAQPAGETPEPVSAPLASMFLGPTRMIRRPVCVFEGAISSTAYRTQELPGVFVVSSALSAAPR
ncbi:MAG: hypothetical protein BWY59_00519 [Verrucomicrobia bacterium ADurb.Bin345]|nr:MAG: hypothetical protein BWY59_00519 [Verrucomicrobia bacterium ADurb.Bin345]